jgi:hypothetical protein
LLPGNFAGPPWNTAWLSWLVLVLVLVLVPPVALI